MTQRKVGSLDSSLSIDTNLFDHPQVQRRLYFLKINTLRNGGITDRDFGRIDRQFKELCIIGGVEKDEG